MGTTTDVRRLRDMFTAMQCPGVVALIDYLASPKGEGVREIGSGTLGLGEILRDDSMSEETKMAAATTRLRSLYIGSRDGSVMPLRWLEDAAGEIARLPESGRHAFDETCRAFAEIAQAKPVGHVEVFTGGGIFSVPAEVHRDDMTAEELEPYRVERSWLDGGDILPHENPTIR